MKKKLKILILLCILSGLLVYVIAIVCKPKEYGMVFDRMTASKHIHEAVLYVENSDGSFSEKYGYNGRDIDTPMICASVTKLFTTACVLELCEEGKLSLDDYRDSMCIWGRSIRLI